LNEKLETVSNSSDRSALDLDDIAVTGDRLNGTKGNYARVDD
jgi:hypothetical protein